ncbi:MAG: PEP-utilizing enzyme, partial [Trueperaceae bacterium]
VHQADTPSWLRDRATLSADGVQEVARTVRSLERRLGRPVDVEFAFEGSELRLLQCRPVTSLPDAPPVPTWREPEDADLHWKRELRHFPEPVPALEGDLMRRFLEAGHRSAMRSLGAPLDWRVRRFWSRVYEHDGTTVPPGPDFDVAMAAAKARIADAIPSLDALWNETWLPEIERRTEALRRIAPGDDASAVRALHEVEEHGRRLWEIHFDLVFPAGAARSRFAEAYGELFPDHGPLAPWELTRGFDVLTTRTSRDFDRVVHAARSAPSVAGSLRERPIIEVWAALQADPEANAFRTALDGYLELHGERAPRLGFTVPTFQEDPTPLLAMIRARLAQGSDAGGPGKVGAVDGESERRRSEAERERRTGEALRSLRSWPRAARDEFRSRLEAARIGTRITEDHNYLIDYRSTAVLRGALLRIAERAVAAGRLARASNVQHLTLDLLRTSFAEGTPLHDEVERAQAAFRDDAAFEPPAEFNPPPRPPARTEASESGGPDDPDLLRGVPASAGRVRGPIRSLRELDARKPIQPGEVLIVPTAGVGWTPAFSVIGALVTESGGPLSHDAVVAREYGLPAVVGVAGAVGRWPDGTVVEVDGEAGTVRRVADPDA